MGGLTRAVLRPAKVEDGQVFVEQDGEFVLADDVQLLAAGGLNSEGAAIIGGSSAIYVVNTQPDLQGIIDKLVEVCTQISSLAITPVSKTPDTTPLNPTIQTEIDLIKTELQETRLI